MNKAIVITSISSPDNKVLQDYAQKATKYGFHFIVAGDDKSPADFKLDGCRFLSLNEQLASGFELAKQLPVRHYARKNLGYLTAMQNGADMIIETDDDNFAKASFWDKRQINVQARHYENTGWFNIYRLFSDENIWPRGFSLEHIKETPFKRDDYFRQNQDFSLEHVSVTQDTLQQCYCPVQQGLADRNPDVDALYRMISPLPVKFKEAPDVALGRNAWCPFNSQNTTWFREAFMLMYLPSYCSFRMTDIWRSFVVQRIGWENDWPVLFHKATVWQERNEHNLLADFQDELPGYIHNNEIIKRLGNLKLPKGRTYFPDNLLACYRLFIELDLMDKNELNLIHSWIRDINALF